MLTTLFAATAFVMGLWGVLSIIGGVLQEKTGEGCLAVLAGIASLVFASLHVAAAVAVNVASRG